MMKCKRCGWPFRDTSFFCGQCGDRRPDGRPFRRRPLGRLLTGVVAVAAIATWVGFFNSLPSPPIPSPAPASAVAPMPGDIGDAAHRAAAAVVNSSPSFNVSVGPDSLGLGLDTIDVTYTGDEPIIVTGYLLNGRIGQADCDSSALRTTPIYDGHGGIPGESKPHPDRDFPKPMNTGDGFQPGGHGCGAPVKIAIRTNRGDIEYRLTQ